MKRPQAEPVEVKALVPWFYGEKEDVLEGQIVGTIETDMGSHFVLEDEKEVRYRLPTHVDLNRKIEAVRMDEAEPWLRITKLGAEEDGKTIWYKVEHFPRK